MPAAQKRSRNKRFAGVDPSELSPGLLRIQTQPTAPFARTLLHVLLVLLVFLILWSALGRLDVVASAEGKLLPQSYLKIVQPSEQGNIRDILVPEGESVKPGQVLMRMDATLSEADGKALEADSRNRQITLRRIDAELSDNPFKRQANDTEQDYHQALAQYQANRTAYETALSQERSMHGKAQSNLASMILDSEQER